MNIKVPKKLKAAFNSDKRYIVLYGGRGGGKSWFIGFILILKALEKPNQIILCTREIQNTIQDSVHSVLSGAIERLGAENFFHITDKKIECKNGSKFIFKGLYRNIQGIKSTEGINYCWIEEGQTISQDSIDLLFPTIRKPDSQIFISFNPGQEDDPIYTRFIKNKRDDTLLIRINYSDNPFFPEVLRQEMLYDKEYNYDKYLHVWEGECKNITEACIFKDKFTVQEFNTPNDVHFFYGADFGFSQDASTLTRCYIKDDCLYIDYDAGGVGIEFEELAKLWDCVPGSRDNKIVADNSRPDTISYMNRQGFYVRPSRKGKNSIEDGIEFMRSFKMIYIHPRCKNTVYEFRSYSYKQDRITNEILPVIVDKDNHYIDALRYSLEDARRGRQNPYRTSDVSLNELLRK